MIILQIMKKDGDISNLNTGAYDHIWFQKTIEYLFVFFVKIMIISKSKLNWKIRCKSKEDEVFKAREIHCSTIMYHDNLVAGIVMLIYFSLPFNNILNFRVETK